MLNIDKVLEIAKKEVGYKEGPNNKNKYAEFFDNEAPDFYNGKKQNVAYCDIFVDYCFCKAYGIETGRKAIYQPKKSCGAGCSFSYKYYKEHNASGSKPKTGSQIFFKNSKGVIIHTGIVTSVDKTHVYTIEGNKDNMVKSCKYPIKSTKIYGYGYPDYNLDESVVSVNKPVKSAYYEVTAKSGLRIRKEPNTISSIIKVMPFGYVIKGVEHNKDWLKVDKGYMSLKWLKKIDHSDEY